MMLKTTAAVHWGGFAVKRVCPSTTKNEATNVIIELNMYRFIALV